MNSRALKQAELFVLLSIIFLLGIVTMDTKNKVQSMQRSLFDANALRLNAERERNTMENVLLETQSALDSSNSRLAMIEEQLQIKSNILTQTKEDLTKQTEKLISTQEELIGQSKKLQDTKDELNNKISILDTTKRELSSRAESLTQTKKLLSSKNSELKDTQKSLLVLSDKLNQKEKKLKKLENDLLRLGTPIFVFSEKKREYSFKSGSAVVPRKLASALEREIIPQLEKRNKSAAFNAIEVVGHTDDQTITQGKSNLDDLMIDVYQGKAQFSALEPGSNTDLGMMRALAIIRIIKGKKDKGRLKNIKYFFPSSSGQIITDKHLIASRKQNKADGSRRRVEIRMLRYVPSNIKRY